MKRYLTALAASVGLLLTAGTGVAAAGDLIAPAPATPLQQNESDQHQVQVVPIAPQANAQNVNVATYGEVEQGNANNANTGQAAQQENTLTSQVSPAHQNVVDGGQGQTGAQENDSDQGQVQVVPVAPQLNVQNVNVGTGGDVEQGNANNANTGQAAQQENTQSGSHGSYGQSQAGAQENDSDQSQVQVVPIAPQANVQNVNVLTFDDVEQGNANNANTGQAAQQENTQSGRASHGSPAPASKHSSSCDRCKKDDRGGQRNDSDQSQVQIVPIAPQANVQNVNVLTFDDVEQGNANNANTGQATQQENTQSGHSSHGSPTRVWKHEKSTCERCPKPSHGGQRNDSHQSQVQIVPIAPQLNVQNVNVLTFGDVEQGNANNANTGQATQQENTRVSGERGKHETTCCPPKHEEKPCPPKGEPKPCPPKHEPKPCPPKNEPKPCPPKHESKPCPPKNEPKPCPPKHEPKPCPPKHEAKPCPPDRMTAQRNESSQRQVQIVPIAPQLNVQNLNVLTFGDVEQGNANNANTGQATQQSNSLLAGHGKGGSRPLV